VISIDVSCGDGILGRRRTELELRSCKPFDDQHLPTTLGAKPSIARTGGGYLCLGLWCRAEQLKAKRQGRGTSAIGQEAEVTDADETLRKDMQQKTGQEFVDGQWQQPLFVGVSGVAPTKRDRSISKRDQAMVGDGHAMGVTAQITKHMLWAPERTFRVDHPVLSEQWSQPRSKGFRLSQEPQVSMKGELAVMESTLECFVELAAKDATEHLHGKKEVVARFDPARVIGRQATSRSHAMYMRVKLEFLIPGVQHAEEADFCTEMLGIARDFEKGFRASAKQEIVEDLLVLQDQRGQMTGKRKDHMHVRRRKKFLATFVEPAIASSCLTLRAVPISTRVVGDGAMSAASAFIEMPAERGGTTPRNGQEHFDMLPGDPLTASDECISRSADQIGHLERWPIHLLVLR